MLSTQCSWGAGRGGAVKGRCREPSAPPNSQNKAGRTHPSLKQRTDSVAPIGQRGGGRWGPGLASCAPGLLIIKPHGLQPLWSVGAPMVCWSSTEGIWKKNQDDEITICPLIWSFGLFKGHTLVCWGGRGRRSAGLPRTSLGSGDPQHHHFHQPLPHTDTRLDKTWSLSGNAAPTLQPHSF